MRPSAAWTVARIDLRQLFKSKDYWVPMIILAGLFFVVIPWMLLGIIGRATGSGLISQIGNVIDALPGPIQENIRGDTPQAQAVYAFALYLLAPIAIIVPLTISSAVGAHTIVGEREKGTGEFTAVRERDLHRKDRCKPDTGLPGDGGRICHLLTDRQPQSRRANGRLVLSDSRMVAIDPLGRTTVHRHRSLDHRVGLVKGEEHCGGAAGRQPA